MSLLQPARRWFPCLAGLWLSCSSQPRVEPHVVVPPAAGVASNYSVPGAALRPAPGDCPMSVEGADVVLVPIDGGGALVFTSSAASPAVLRKAVRRFAQDYQSQGELPSAAGIPTSVLYADTLAGARVEIRALADRQAAELEQYLQRLTLSMRERRSCSVPAIDSRPS